MKIKFKPVIMNCIQCDNNFDEVVELIKNEYGNKFELNFRFDPNSDDIKDCMLVDFDGVSYTRTYYIENGDYIVCLPTGLSLYDQTQFEQLFELC